MKERWRERQREKDRETERLEEIGRYRERDKARRTKSGIHI